MHTNWEPSCAYHGAHPAHGVGQGWGRRGDRGDSPRITPVSDRSTTVSRARVNEPGMRIRTDGDYGHRLDTIRAAMDALDENTKTGAVLAAREHIRRKETALSHPHLTEDPAVVLTTSEL